MALRIIHVIPEAMPGTKEAPFACGEEISIRIERLASGGAGVGRVDGFVVFVPFTAPGDLCLARIEKIHRKYAEAKWVKIVEPGSERVEPKCSVYGRCGGCSWQQVSYSEQLKQKQAIVEKALSPLNLSAEIIQEIVSSPRIWNYRNRVQFRALPNQLGFFQRKSNEIVDIQNCIIAEESINDEIPRLKQKARDLKPGKKFKVELSLQEDGSVMESYNKEHGQDVGFSQVNRFQNKNLVGFVCKQTELTMPEVIYDLYSGSGNFTFALGKAHPYVSIMACELNKQAVSKGIEKSIKHDLQDRIRFAAMDVYEFLTKVEVGPPDLVILDPPRGGCQNKVLEALVDIQPKMLIYVSCHPMTMARDLKVLQQSTCFTVKSVQAFDMFPHCDHVEVVSVLTS